MNVLLSTLLYSSTSLQCSGHLALEAKPKLQDQD